MANSTPITPQDVLDRIEDDRFNGKYLLQSTQTDADIHFLLDHVRTITAERDRYREALDYYAYTLDWLSVNGRLRIAREDSGSRARAALAPHAAPGEAMDIR